MIDAIVRELKKLNIPIRYRVFKEAPPVPFMVYYLDYSENFGADGKVYLKQGAFILEFYADKKEKVLEGKIEDTFDRLGVFWDKDETYVESEKLILTSYYFDTKGE